MLATQIRTRFSFDTKLIWGWVAGTYKQDFLEAITQIYKEVNYNENKINAIGITEDFSMETFYNVFNTYGNVLIEYKSLPEYDGNQPDNYNIATVSEVAKHSGLTVTLTNRILKQLFWSTEQGRVLSYMWIKPRTWLESAGYRELRTDAKGSDWLQKLLWIIGLVGVSVAGFYAFKMYATYKVANSTRKRLTK